MTKLTPAEQKAITNWINTDTGAALLAVIADQRQGYLDEAMLNTKQGPQFTHDRVVAAQAIDTIYEWLKAYRKPDTPTEEE